MKDLSFLESITWNVLYDLAPMLDNGLGGFDNKKERG
jgi:hypothetical protein